MGITEHKIETTIHGYGLEGQRDFVSRLIMRILGLLNALQGFLTYLLSPADSPSRDCYEKLSQRGSAVSGRMVYRCLVCQSWPPAVRFRAFDANVWRESPSTHLPPAHCKPNLLEAPNPPACSIDGVKQSNHSYPSPEMQGYNTTGFFVLP